MEGQAIYIFNGILMGISFFIFRVLFYHVVIWTYVYDNVILRSTTLWPIMYPTPMMDFFGKVAIILYLNLFLLQLFWFSKIFAGILKAIGLEELF
jgi:hypothetical protein